MLAIKLKLDLQMSLALGYSYFTFKPLKYITENFSTHQTLNHNHLTLIIYNGLSGQIVMMTTIIERRIE